jgi:hypothetical protein
MVETTEVGFAPNMLAFDPSLFLQMIVFALSSVLAAVIQQTQETKKSKNFSSLFRVQNIK